MISLQITSVKTFMSHLLLSETFDRFQFIEGEIVTFNTFTIDGYTQKAFFSKEDDVCEYSYWNSLREYCFTLIRGKQTPLSFKFIFRLSPDKTAELIQQSGLDFQTNQVQGLYLNIHYDGSSLRCTTGTSFKLFTFDKSLEHTWDQTVLKFFSSKDIPFDIL